MSSYFECPLFAKQLKSDFDRSEAASGLQMDNASRRRYL